MASHADPFAELPRAVVVLGAGASYDVWNGAGPRNEAWRPPLADELFAYQPEFWNILTGYHGATVLQQELAPLSESGALRIEDKLREYAFHEDARVREHFKDVPAYVRDVISESSRRYLPGLGSGSYAQLVKRLLADVPHCVAFVLLNYDTLLEVALDRFDSDLTIRSLSDYGAPTRQAIIVKLHGSVDWVTPIAGPVGSWREALAGFDPVGSLGEIRLERPASIQKGPIALGRAHKEWVYPVITAPLAGKQAAFACPTEHVEALSSFIAACRKYLFIGTSGQDNDLLDFLASHVPEGSVAHHVGWESDAASARRRVESAVAQLADNPVLGNLYVRGFREYLVSEDFERFLALPADPHFAVIP